MSLLPDNTLPEPHDPPVTRSQWRISLVWLVPLVAALIGLSMVVHAWLSTGPEITLSFQTAAGLEAGKTPVKYKDVTVGTVSSVSLSDNGSHVVARVSLAKSAQTLTRADTRFWVVRPRIGIGGVSGVDTLLSGAYIGVDTGTSKESRTTFTGLETPPAVINGVPGTSFAIHTHDLGSLDIGSPVYYRRIQVGRVTSYGLDTDGRSVNVQIFVDAPYDLFVKVGDMVSISGVEGDIRRINVRATEIQLADRSTVIVPNSQLISQNLRNVTGNSTQGVTTLTLTFPLDIDPEQVRDLLLGAYLAHPSILENPAPSVTFSQLTPDGITLSVTGYVRSPRITGETKSDLLFEILKRLRAASIPLSNPQTVMVRNLPESDTEPTLRD